MYFCFLQQVTLGVIFDSEDSHLNIFIVLYYIFLISNSVAYLSLVLFSIFFIMRLFLLEFFFRIFPSRCVGSRCVAFALLSTR
jgi:hypothetical protein